MEGVGSLMGGGRWAGESYRVVDPNMLCVTPLDPYYPKLELQQC